MEKVVLVIGLSRSGTTLVTNLLGQAKEFSVEVEPHALWKTGNFKYLNDEEFHINESIVKRIRTAFMKNLVPGKKLLEKSPINALRPDLVHAVFPEAKIVYVERDAVRCVYSNYVRSLKNDSFKPSITLKKYFLKAGSSDLPFAMSARSLFSQISISDIPSFLRYVLWMVFMRNIKPGLFPFGPKLKGFMELVKSKGLLAYHVMVYKKSLKYQQKYKELYGHRLQLFRLEDLMANKEQLKELYHWVEVDINDEEMDLIFEQIDKDRKHQAVKQNPIDSEIKVLLDQIEIH